VTRLKRTISFADDLWQEPQSVRDGDPPFVGSPTALVRWLNSALSGPEADREAAERVSRLLEEMLSWQDKARHPVDRELATFKPSEHVFELALSPPNTVNDSRWRVFMNCVPADSRWRGSQSLSIPWPGCDTRLDPELIALGVIVKFAVTGKLGRIRRCENCRNWLLTKNDLRVRACGDQCFEQQRRNSLQRKAQLKAAKARQAESAKREDEEFFKKEGTTKWKRDRSKRR